VTATLVDEATIEGSASATVLRSDYGIGIPNAPGVADVGDEVLIRMDFVATA
jgi:polyisoprenoid-binding protein YceI